MGRPAPDCQATLNFAAARDNVGAVGGGANWNELRDVQLNHRHQHTYTQYQYSAFRYPTKHSRHCNKSTYFGSMQWCRCVVNYGVSVSQVKPSNCSRRLEKLVLGLHAIFDTSLSSRWCENCRVIQQQFWMKEYDIFTLTPTNFQGQDTPTPQDLRPGRIMNTDWIMTSWPS